MVTHLFQIATGLTAVAAGLGIGGGTTTSAGGATVLSGGALVAPAGMAAVVGVSTGTIVAVGGAVSVGVGAIALPGALADLNQLNAMAQGPGGGGGRPNWSPHGNKHVASGSTPWSRIVEGTRRGPAKYRPGTAIEALERQVWSTGRPTTNGRNWRVMEFGSEIGASEGASSNWVLVEESAGTIHGRPISQAEFARLTR